MHVGNFQQKVHCLVLICPFSLNFDPLLGFIAKHCKFWSFDLKTQDSRFFRKDCKVFRQGCKVFKARLQGFQERLQVFLRQGKVTRFDFFLSLARSADCELFFLQEVQVRASICCWGWKYCRNFFPQGIFFGVIFNFCLYIPKIPNIALCVNFSLLLLHSKCCSVCEYFTYFKDIPLPKIVLCLNVPLSPTYPLPNCQGQHPWSFIAHISSAPSGPSLNSHLTTLPHPTTIYKNPLTTEISLS